MRLPIGTRIYDDDKSYWLIGESTFDGFDGNRLVCSHTHDKYPQWMDDSDWRYPWRIELPQKERLFDKLYLILKNE